jgi:predicted permease
VGRLAPGVSVGEARARLELAARQLHAAYAEAWSDHAGGTRRLELLPEAEARISPRGVGPVLGFSALLALVAGIVLLIAVANVGNLMLARAASRRREIAVRLALGASRGRVVRHFLTESLLVAALGGALGLLIAAWAGQILSALRPPTPVPIQLEVAIDARVLAFTVGLTLLTGVLLGLLPGLQAARPDLVPALKNDEAGPTTSRRGRRLGRLFVTAQVALSTVLLIGASLLLRGLARATDVSPGFDVEAPQLVPVDLGLAGYDVAQTADLIERLAERLPGLPGVRAAGLTLTLPLELHTVQRTMRGEGHVPGIGEDEGIYFGVVGPGHFEALGIPIRRGRGFEPADRADSPGVVVINERLAERFWPGQDPVGRRVLVGGGGELPASVPADDPRWREVVGVAADSTYRTLGEEPLAFLYLPITQDFGFVERYARFFPLHVALRGDGDPEALRRSVAGALAEIDPELPVFPARSLRDWLGLALLPTRVASAAFAGFGVLGLALASLGVYGVVAYSVARRTREIGVRLALGASARDVLNLVLRDGLRLAASGLLLGALLSASLARALGALLFGLPPFDPVSFAVVPALLALVSFAASALPARRAVRVDPVDALRRE